MEVTVANCMYCEQKCSKREEDKDTLPLLFTPSTFGMRRIVCGECLRKLAVGMDAVFTAIAKGETV